MAEMGDVPSVIRGEGRKWPLGRYLVSKVREGSGYGTDGELSPGYVQRLLELQLELREPGKRDYREQVRKSVARRAYTLSQISRSKKGTGV